MQSWKMLIRTNLQYKKVPSKKNITKIIMKKKIKKLFPIIFLHITQPQLIFPSCFELLKVQQWIYWILLSLIIMV